MHGTAKYGLSRECHLPNGVGVFYFRLVKQASSAHLNTVNHFTFKKLNIFFIPVLKD